MLENFEFPISEYVRRSVLCHFVNALTFEDIAEIADYEYVSSPDPFYRFSRTLHTLNIRTID